MEKEKDSGIKEKFRVKIRRQWKGKMKTGKGEE